MFIDKARQLQNVQAIGGIVIDHDTSLKSSNGSIFSMTGDGNNNVRIPLVLMFQDEAFHLLHVLSKYPNLIVYIGEANRLSENFYQQMDVLESVIEPFNQTCEKWIYGQRKWFEGKNLCLIVPQKLKQLELIIKQEAHDAERKDTTKHPIIQFEHVIESRKKIW